MSKHLLSLVLHAYTGQGLMVMETTRPNDVQDRRAEAWALTGATIQINPEHRIGDATLLIREGRVVEVLAGRKVPTGFVEHDVSGRMIYPGLIDLDSAYGLPKLEKPGRRRWGQAEILECPPREPSTSIRPSGASIAPPITSRPIPKMPKTCAISVSAPY